MCLDLPHLKKTQRVEVILGADFDANETKYKEPLPHSTEFIVFKFSKANESESHSRIFQCKFGDNCHRVIQSPSKFYDHLRSHTCERPFVCHHCDAAFAQKTNLVKHLQHVHDRQQLFECNHCKRTFSRKFNRDNHMKCCKFRHQQD